MAMLQEPKVQEIAERRQKHKVLIKGKDQIRRGWGLAGSGNHFYIPGLPIEFPIHMEEAIKFVISCISGIDIIGAFKVKKLVQN